MTNEKPMKLGVKVTPVNRTVMISTRDSHKYPCSICTVGVLVQREFELRRFKTKNPEQALQEAILAADRDYPGFAAAITGYSERVETTFDVDLDGVERAPEPGENQ
jgi:hypothetical protein